MARAFLLIVPLLLACCSHGQAPVPSSSPAATAALDDFVLDQNALE